MFGSDGGDLAPGPVSLSQLRRLRLWLYASFGLLFVVAMALAGPLAPSALAPDGPSLDTILRVLAVAIAMPLVMAFLARRVIDVAAGIERVGGRVAGTQPVSGAALTDQLSGLGSNRAFQEELARHIQLAQEQRYPLAVVLADIDDMQRVNDERGPAGGDRVLAEMGRLILSFCRRTDRAFRIAGDEFAILLPRADIGMADAVARRLLAAALNTETTRPNAETFSFSAGVAAFPGTAEDPRTLLHQAEAAMAWAKGHGRTDVQAYDAARHGASVEARSASDLADALTQVIAERQLAPVYQTIYDLRTGEALGIEGMVRPFDESGFADSRSLFLAAETAGRSVELDRLSMEAIAAGAQLPEAPIYLAFNVSPRTIETEQFRVTELLMALAPHGIRPDRVVLELTERQPIEDIDRLRTNLERCQSEGIRIAADDVGAGTNGLRLLSEIKFDIVKIDLSMVRGGVLRESGMAVLRAIRDIGLHCGRDGRRRGGRDGRPAGGRPRPRADRRAGLPVRATVGEVHAEALDLKALLAAHAARRKAMGAWFDLDVA